MAINITNNSYKQFVSQVKQAKLQGAKELRIPIKQAEDMIMDISIVLIDKLAEVKPSSTDNTNSTSYENLSLHGGTFKKTEE